MGQPGSVETSDKMNGGREPPVQLELEECEESLPGVSSTVLSRQVRYVNIQAAASSPDRLPSRDVKGSCKNFPESKQSSSALPSLSSLLGHLGRQGVWGGGVVVVKACCYLRELGPPPPLRDCGFPDGVIHGLSMCSAAMLLQFWSDLSMNLKRASCWAGMLPSKHGGLDV